MKKNLKFLAALGLVTFATTITISAILFVPTPHEMRARAAATTSTPFQVNVQDYGVLPSLADCTPAFQAMLATFTLNPDKEIITPEIWFPPSAVPYTFLSPPDLTNCLNLSLRGQGFRPGGNGGAILQCNFAGPLWNYCNHNGRFVVDGLTIKNNNAAGAGIYIKEGFFCRISNNLLNCGHYDIQVGDIVSSYQTEISGNELDGRKDGAGNLTTAGLIYWSTGIVRNNSGVGLAVGAQVCGQAGVWSGNRFEVCVLGIHTGIAPNGNNSYCGIQLLGTEMEACDTFLRLRSTGGLIAGLGTHGSPGSPSQNSATGILFEDACPYLTIESTSIGGGYTNAALASTVATGGCLMMPSTLAQNGIPGKPVWNMVGGGYGGCSFLKTQAAP